MTIDLTDTSPENQPAIIKLVATEVLGWVWHETQGGRWFDGSWSRYHWNPFTNANHDVTVLEFVRETWDRTSESWSSFCYWVDFERGWQYERGDYTIAACRVLQGRETDG